jgi:outer membrane receptor protein involved in Fe transport
MPRWINRRVVVLALACIMTVRARVAEAEMRTLSGVVIDNQNSIVPGVTVTARSNETVVSTQTDGEGHFSLAAPTGSLTISVSGSYIVPEEQILPAASGDNQFRIHVHYAIAPVHESLVITATALEPEIDRRNDSVYKNTLFSRDDQMMDTLAAGINAGQHEGGGKSLEIRRFGFNLDHGGVNGGLKVLVDDVQQNQATQGHGQGYLGSLKALTPELVDDVDILNGPFSAEYGDFSGLGVVHIRTKEALPDKLTIRLQGGSFDSFRTFVGYSPSIAHVDSFLSYEGSRTDGPFLNPLRYARDNVTANYTWHLSEHQWLGFKANFGRNDFYSSGQLPLDLVSGGDLNRFGYIDPYDGGRVRLGTFATYYKKEMSSGDLFKIDGFLGRSLFDLYSNFTFYLNDPVNGDEIQQHDSRLQEGINTQYLHPYKLFGRSMLLTVGSNFHDNQINVDLFHTERREVLAETTGALAHVTNVAGYLEQGVDLLQQKLHLDAGIRYDYFRFQVDDQLVPANSGTQPAGRWQPKANAAYTPWTSIPITFHASYGRGISSQDARGVVQHPDSPRLATTDFYQVGTSHNLRRFSLATDLFLINRSNEEVYIPDDGSFEFKGPSRSYGWEAKSSVSFTQHVSLNGGFTQVTNAYYRGTSPRVYVDSAPHSVGNAGLTVSSWHGFYSSLRYRHISAYRLDGLDPTIRATGLDVVDWSVSKQVRHNVDFNFAVDNLNDKTYYETQNYFESRVTPTSPAVNRIHGTPGYPIGFTIGMTFRLGEK